MGGMVCKRREDMIGDMTKHVLHNYVPWRSQNSLWFEALADLEALQEMVIVSCNDERCGWVGCLVETKSPKHSPEKILCPQCSETTETVTPAWFADLRKQIAELEAQLQDSQNEETP